jgi:type I restriction enzyme S subunit
MKGQIEINNSALCIPNSELPEGWRWVKLGDVCERFVNGGTPDTGISTYWDGDIPWITGADVTDFWVSHGRKLITEEGLKKSATNLVPRNTVLVVTRTGVGKVGIAANDLCFSQDITGIICGEKIFPEYLARFILFQGNNLTNIQRGATIKGVTRADIEDLDIPLPPLSEQQRIAARLQELMQEVDRARTACEKQLETAKALPSVYLREVFEGEKLKNWERRRLGEVCEIFSGSSAPQEKKYFENEKYPFVRVQDLGKYGRTINLVNIKDYINDHAIRELNLIKAEKGTILFPKSGAAITTNNRAILGVDAFIVSHLAAIKPREEVVDTYFVYYWLCLTDMVHYMENPGYPSLKLSTISKIDIPLPSLSEQNRITTELKKKLAEAENLQSAIKNQQSALKDLPQAILRKAFRGEL